MRLATTYLFRQFTLSFLAVAGILSSLAFMSELSQAARRFSDKADVTEVLLLAILNLPASHELIVIFATLISFIFAVRQMEEKGQINLLNVAGYSWWRVGLVASIVGLVLGLITITGVSRVSYLASDEYERRAGSLNTYYTDDPPGGIAWTNQGENGEAGEKIIILGNAIGSTGLTIANPFVIVEDLAPETDTGTGTGTDTRRQRLRAASARLRDGFWLLTGAEMLNADGKWYPVGNRRLKTSLNRENATSYFADSSSLDLIKIGQLLLNNPNDKKYVIAFHQKLSYVLYMAGLAGLAAVAGRRNKTGTKFSRLKLVSGVAIVTFILWRALSSSSEAHYRAASSIEVAATDLVVIWFLPLTMVILSVAITIYYEEL